MLPPTYFLFCAYSDINICVSDIKRDLVSRLFVLFSKNKEENGEISLFSRLFHAQGEFFTPQKHFLQG